MPHETPLEEDVVEDLGAGAGALEEGGGAAAVAVTGAGAGAGEPLKPSNVACVKGAVTVLRATIP